MLRVTLRELLLLTAFIGGGLAALKYAGATTFLVLANGVHLCLMVAAVFALVDRGRRQAIASGFAACLAIYLALLMVSYPQQGRYTMITGKLLGTLYEAMAVRTYFDRQTGMEIPYDPQWRISGYPNNLQRDSLPDGGHFAAVGHYLWALLFGYLGSRLAAWIYARRVKAEAVAKGSPPKP